MATVCVRRRDLLGVLGVAVPWSGRAAAQQLAALRRVGVLFGTARDDPETNRRIEGLSRGLREHGWIENRTVRFDYRFSGANRERMRADAHDIASLSPDVIVVQSNLFVVVLREIDRTIPAVFVQIGDPVGSGFVDGLAHPGGNMTGFTSFEPGIGGKWLETLAELAPPLERCLVLVEPNNDAHRAFLRSVQSAGQARRVAVFDAAFGADEDGTFAQFAREPRGGLVVLPSPAAVARRAKITALAVQYGLPAVYPYRFFVMDGGLAAYGVDTTDLYRRAGEYVDRILKGAKPADLPVQQPTKYELVINLRTAKAMRLAIPPTVLARADEVIE